MPRKRINPVNLKENNKLFVPETRGRKKDIHKKIPSEIELYSNFRTYCEELLWIRDKRGTVIPFRWNNPQIRLNARIEEELARGRRYFLVLKYRRPGITTYFQARSFFHTANAENQYAVTLAHDNQSTSKIFDISLLYYSKLESWARPQRKRENKRELNFNGLGSVFYIGTAGGESFGRGMTLQKVHGSEVAFWPKATDVPNLIAGLMQATTHGDMALESTANGVGNWFHKNWMAAKEGENEWVPIFLSWKDDPELCLPTNRNIEELRLSTEEETLVKVYDLSPGQILWRRQKQRELFDPDRGDALFKQEYPINDIEAFISSGSCFFDGEVVANLVNQCSPPIHTADNGRLKIYANPFVYRAYVIGMDIGEGVPGSNRTVITIMDTHTCEEVASWVGICSPEEAGRKAAELGHLYHSALIAPEANNYGHSSINTLMHEVGYPNIYEHTDYQRPTTEGGFTKFGWQTNAKTRPILLSEFRQALQGGLYKANDKELFSECLSFIDNGHGKYEAAPGSYDDRIIAHAIAWQARTKQIEITDFSKYAVDTGHTSIDAQWEEF